MSISGELCNLLGSYLAGSMQRVAINGQTSSWRPVLAGVPQGVFLGPLLSLICVNDLPNELKSNVKLFADDTSLFTIVKDKNESANTLNDDLILISKWAFNKKMLFNPDSSFLTQPQNDSFSEELESIQYKAALAITGAIQGTSWDKIYQELGPESLKSRKWYKRLGLMFRIMKEEAPNYLINLIPKCEQIIRTRNNRIPIYYCRKESFKHSFFTYTLKDCFSLDNSIKNSETIATFKNRLSSFIRPVQNNIFNIFDPIGLNFLTRLRLGFSHLNEHNFRQFEKFKTA